MYQHVVPIKAGTRDGWSTAEASMRTVPVVVMEPMGKMRGAFLRSVVGAGISPLAQRGLNEPLGFPVGAWGIRPRANMSNPVLLTHRAKNSRLVTRPIVGEQASHADSQSGVPSQRDNEKGRRRNSLLIAGDLREGNARVIVNGHVDVFPPSVGKVLITIAMDSVPHTTKTAQFLDVQMQQITGTRVFVASRRRGWIQISQATDPLALQDAADRGRTQAGRTSNAAAGPALATKRLHLLDQRRRGRTIEAVRTRTAIQQASAAVRLKTAHPLGRSTRADFELGCSRVQSHSWSRSPSCQRLSTIQSKSGILMDVHSTSRNDGIAQHNQHLRFWSNGQPVERSQLVARVRTESAKGDTSICTNFRLQ